MKTECLDGASSRSSALTWGQAPKGWSALRRKGPHLPARRADEAFLHARGGLAGRGSCQLDMSSWSV